MNLYNSLLVPVALATLEQLEERPKTACACIIILCGAAARLGAMHSVALAIAAFAITLIASLNLLMKVDLDDVTTQASRLITPNSSFSGHPIQVQLWRALEGLTRPERKQIVDQTLSIRGDNDSSDFITSKIFNHLIKFNTAERKVIVEQTNRFKNFFSMGKVLTKDEFAIITRILPLLNSDKAKALVDQVIEKMEKKPASQGRSAWDAVTILDHLSRAS